MRYLARATAVGLLLGVLAGDAGAGNYGENTGVGSPGWDGSDSQEKGEPGVRHYSTPNILSWDYWSKPRSSIDGSTPYVSSPPADIGFEADMASRHTSSGIGINDAGRLSGPI